MAKTILAKTSDGRAWKVIGPDGLTVDYIHKVYSPGPGPVFTAWETFDESGKRSRYFAGKLRDFAQKILNESPKGTKK